MTSEDDDSTLVEGRLADSTVGETAPIGTAVGRYVVLEELGAGAMGVVLRAYDPRMRREVALKLLRSRGGLEFAEARARQLREARALAQLSHPNVVTVYDAEPLGTGVAIVMELVEGQTLRQWLKEATPSLDEILEVGLACGAGLAALHERGLVHRDVKPDNILVDPQQRRVVLADFGLVLSEDSPDIGPTGDTSVPDPIPVEPIKTETGATLGTPAYMAPEQHLGKTAGPSVDQYALCVMLWEAIHGKRPFASGGLKDLAQQKLGGPPSRPPTAIPAWLHDALSRGLAPRPEERWPDVDALCEALRFSKRKVRRRRALIAGVAAIGLLGTGIAVREVDRRRQVAACQSDAAALVDGVWIEGARERLESRLVGEAGVQGTESFERAATALDEALGEIEAEYRRVCVEAKVERSWGDHDYAKAVSCLQRVRDETAARVAWIDGVETSLMQVVVPMVQGLTDPAPCVDRIDLETQPEPFSDPDQRAQEARLSRLNLEASGSLHLGKLDEAGAAVAEMRQLAEQTGVERYRMMAMATSVEIHLGSENPEEARPDVEAAFIELGAGGFDEMALHAGAMLVYTVGARLRQPDAALVYVDAIRVLTSGLEGSAMEIERARLLDAEGAVHSMRGSLDKAIAAHEKGLEILEREYGSDHLDVAMTLTNLGADHYMAGNYDLSVEHMRRALAIRTARLGADHPTVLQARANLALVLEDVGRADESEKEFRALLPKLREAFGPVDGRLLATYMMLSRYALLREDFEEALEFAKLSQEVTELSYGARHPEMIDRLTDLGVTQYKKGDHEEGLRTLQSAVTLGNEILGTDRVDLGTPLEALAELAYDRGDPGQTIQWAEQALEAWATGEFPPAESAALRFLMAKALWDTGRDRERALSIARDVRDVLTGTESTYERETYDEAKAWLAEHEPLLDAEAR